MTAYIVFVAHRTAGMRESKNNKLLKYRLNVSPLDHSPFKSLRVHPYGHLHQSVDRCQLVNPIARIRAHSQSLIVSLNLWKTVHLRYSQSISRLLRSAPFKLSICQLPHRRPLEKGLPLLFSRQCTPYFQPHFHVYQSAPIGVPFNSLAYQAKCVREPQC